MYFHTDPIKLSHLNGNIDLKSGELMGHGSSALSPDVPLFTPYSRPEMSLFPQ